MCKKMKTVTSNPNKGVFLSEEYIDSNNVSNSIESCVINVFPEIQYQSVLGFGGAFTESSAYNYSLLDKPNKEKFMEAYFSRDKGIGYNFGRTHIGSCDFALDIYSYVKEGDATLESFSIERDRKYIIPFIKDAMKYCESDIFLFASPWSPPAYMKTNNSVIEGGSVADNYKSLWALYYTKYIKAYANEGIHISAISVQNEPKAVQTWESCFYTAEDERDFIKDYLAPALDSAGLNDVKIIIWDHNKERVYDRAREVLEDISVKDKVWAVGHHWYSGEHFEGVRLVNEVLKKPTICTEYCCLYKESDVNSFAEMYAKEMIGNFNNGDIASCDWNLLLDQCGGPYHNRTKRVKSEEGVIVYEQTDSGCYSPIIYNTEKKELVFTPIYYYIGHISKYVKPGAKVVATTKYTSQLEAIAFLNTDNTCILVIMNTSDKLLPANIRVNNLCTAIKVEPHSIITVEL